MKNWLRWVTLAISLVPVSALLLIVAGTVWQSLPALQQIGIGHMLGTELAAHFTRAPRVQYGMLTPIWGTFEIAILAMLLALPVATAFAVVSREFRVPFLSRAIGTIMGALGGIPPIIYGLMSIFFMETFMRPKLAASDIADIQVKAMLQGTAQYAQIQLPIQFPNTTLLGVVLMALFIVPFMAPLIDDAIRTVPLDLKQGSYALGASRWQTLWKIVLPHAVPGIVTAVALGTLVGIGEILIPSWAVGGAENPVSFPKPFWNLLTHTPTLSTTAASLTGVGGEAESINPLQSSMGYVASLILLGFALLVMAAETLVQRQLRRSRA